MALGHESTLTYSAARQGWPPDPSVGPVQVVHAYHLQGMKMKAKQLLALPLIAALLSACTATTSLRSSDPSLAVKINDDAPLVLKNPVSKTYKATSFGQYRFRATQEGMAPMYGLIPLKFNGGYLAADILFFAPAAFYNLREVYPFYEFDVAQGVVRYKKKESDAWISYKPTAAEAERAQAYFAK